MVESYHPLRIFTGSAHPGLAREITDILHVDLGKATTRRMPDSETHVMLDEVVRDQDIFFIQPCSEPVNDHLVEMILYLDAFRRASAHSVSVVIPYFPYARQERMAKGREAGVRGTPSFYINGRAYEGGTSPAELTAAIEAELAGS